MKQSGFLHEFSEPSTPAITLAEAGRLSVGEKHAKGYPVKLDHFKVRNADKIAVAAFKGVYGDRPKELAVTFLSNNPLEVCKTQFEIRCGKSCYAKGDGRVFTYWHVYDWSEPGKGENRVKVVNTEQERDIFMLEIEADVKKAAKILKRTPGEWSVRLRLTVWLPEVNVPGVWVFQTGGKATSIKKIAGVFKTVLLSAGRVQFMPFRLRVRIHTSDNMAGNSYPIVELLPPSQQVMEASSKYGQKLFNSLFGSGGMRMLNEAEIMETAMELEAKTGEAYNSAPVTGDPEGLKEKLADTYFENVENEAPNLSGKPAPGSLQFNLQAIKGAEELSVLLEIWEKVPTPQRQESIRLAYVIQYANLCGTKWRLDKLVKENVEFHNNKLFKQAVQEARQALLAQ